MECNDGLVRDVDSGVIYCANFERLTKQSMINTEHAAELI